MANYGDVKLSDRDLEAYIRQQKIPSEYPNISRLIGGASGYLASPEQIQNLVAARANPVGPISQRNPLQPLDLQRLSEEAASNALALDTLKDKTDKNPFSAEKLIDALQKRDGISYDVEINPKLGPTGGAYLPSKNTMQLPPNPDMDALADTILHEHQHAKDYQQQGYLSENANENPTPGTNSLDMARHSAENDVAAITPLISEGHFQQPGSGTLNQFVSAVQDIARKSAIDPDYKSKYPAIDKLLGNK